MPPLILVYTQLLMDKAFLSLSPEVQAALAANQPVVALESTVIAHGLPRPQNLETARRLERIIRETGSLAATIAILDGQLCVGLNDEQIRFVAESEADRVESATPVHSAQEERP